MTLKAKWAYWLRGHEGEGDNCFSKIQLVGQTKPSSWYVCNVMPGIEEVAESNEDFPSRENSSPSTAWGLKPPPPRPHLFQARFKWG